MSVLALVDILMLISIVVGPICLIAAIIISKSKRLSTGKRGGLWTIAIILCLLGAYRVFALYNANEQAKFKQKWMQEHKEN